MASKSPVSKAKSRQSAKPGRPMPYGGTKVIRHKLTPTQRAARQAALLAAKRARHEAEVMAEVERMRQRAVRAREGIAKVAGAS